MSKNQSASKHRPAYALRLEWHLEGLPAEERDMAEALCRQFAWRFAFAEHPYDSIVPVMARAVSAWGGTCESDE